MSFQKEYFKSLTRLSRELGKTDDQDKMLQLIVTMAAETLKAKAAVIFLNEEDSQEFIRNVAVVQVGLSEKYIHAGTAHAVKISPQLLKDGYMYFRDATTDKRLMNHKAKKEEGIGSILSVPVIVKGQMLGILSLYTKNIRTFTKDEIDFLSILAEQGGAAIETANLIRQLRNQSKIFLKLATSISASLDVKNILQAMTEDLVKDLRIKAASVRLLDDKTRTLKLVASFGLSDKYLNKGPIMADKNIGRALKGQTINIKNVFEDDGIQYKKEKKKRALFLCFTFPLGQRTMSSGF